MPSPFQAENQNLAATWQQYPREHLDTYLVNDTEDPRINAQSILTRALVADTLWPNRFANLIDDELRFGTVLTWLLGQLHGGSDPYALLDTLAMTIQRPPQPSSEEPTASSNPPIAP